MPRPAEQTDVVVVGAGPAAAALVFDLNRGGFEGSVRVLGDEAYLAYDRTVVSKGQLSEGANPPPLFADVLRPLTSTSTAVIEIDRGARQVVLADGSAMGYGDLVLAMGAEPKVPPLEGIDQPGVSLLRTAEDGAALHDRLGAGTRLVIVGGGVIGLEVAAAARQRGGEVVVLEAARLPMIRVLPPAITEVLLEHHATAGTTIRLGVLPQQIVAAGDRLRVACADGTAVDGDHVLVAVGARPRSALAEAAGLAVQDGVLVDEMLCTADPSVSAVGDVARVRAADGTTTRTEAYTPAMAMGQHVAARLLGSPRPYREVPWSWSDQNELTVQAAGWPDRATGWVARGSAADLDAGMFAFGVLEGRIVAAAGVARGRMVGRIMKGARVLIAAGIVVEAAALADPEVDLRKLARTSSAPS